MRYKADITAGALKLPESRLVADLLLRKVDAETWKDAIVTKNVLQGQQHQPSQQDSERTGQAQEATNRTRHL
jgi:hypothetical protein